jgi:hypothetical protein
MANPCTYIIEINGKEVEFTKDELLEHLLKQDLSKYESVFKSPEMMTTSIKNAVTEQERADKGLEKIEVDFRRTFPEVADRAKKMVDNGEIKIRDITKEVNLKPRPLSAEESAALLYDRMRIQNEYRDKINEINGIDNDPSILEDNKLIRKAIAETELSAIEERGLANDEAARKTGYEQGLGLAIRRAMIKEDYSLLNQKNQYKAANGGEELTPEIKKKLEDNVAKLEEAQKALDDYEKQIKELQEKNKELEAAKKVEAEAKKTPKKVNKTDADFKIERESIFNNIKDKWDKASKGAGGLTAVPLPYSAQLAAISPEVLKLVKSYAEQGVVKLDDIVKDLHENLSKVIPEITKKDVRDILAGEYTEQKKKTPPPVDKEKIKLESNYNRIKNQIDLEKEEIKRSRNSNLVKATDWLQNWRRAALLSGGKVLGKIGISGGLRVPLTSAESIIGYGIGKFIPKLAKGAPREGGFNAKAEGKAFAQFVDKATREDIRTTFKTGRSELDELHDKKLYPSHGWLDFFGNLHAAIKVLPKRAEYFRSLEYRAQHALENGKDLTDPVVQQDIATQAYADAQRAIYMQDNKITDLYKHVTNWLEKGGSGSKTAANVLKFIFPIVKVPTNFVIEESSYILGGVKAAVALRKGVEKLTPEQKDYVMKAIKKQGVGIGLMMLGYMNPQAVGGYYSGNRKRGDLEAGDLTVFGVHMPHWALHTPMLEALQVGATIRRARDKAGRSYHQKDLHVFTGVPQALIGMGSQVPFLSGTRPIVNALSAASKGDYDKFVQYIDGQAASLLPQGMKEASELADRDKNGTPIKRKPEEFTDYLKMYVPGLRQEVKAKK